MNYKQIAMEKHREWKGKIETRARVGVNTPEDLAIAYTPGVAEPCIAIQKDKSLSFSLTRRWNTVAVVTDGTAVLGLGDIGPEAGMPVMEGKCVLFKSFGDIDAVPLCIRTKDTDEIVKTISLLAGSFGGINLEDIAAPRCFEIEKKLKESCDIPVFHDDQHGTAVVILAGIINAMKVVGKKPHEVSVVISGAGAAGTATADLMLKAGYEDIIVCNRKGALARGLSYDNPLYTQIAEVTNPRCKTGPLGEMIKDADIFIGVSGPDLLTPEMVAGMKKDPIVFALANPIPEIMPEEAKKSGARIIATGRSDFPNQLNNVLVFPGIFRGALDVRAKDINERMKLAAAYALAGMVRADELSEDYIIPSPFNKQVVPTVAQAVAKAAIESEVAMS